MIPVNQSRNEIADWRGEKSMSQSCCIHLLLFLCICFSISGCGNKGALETAKPVPSPAQISSSAEVVRVSARPVVIRHDGSAGSQNAEVVLSISPGFHINANPATFPYLIATELLSDKIKEITTGKPIYPSAINKKFEFAEQPLAVYEGNAVIELPIRATISAPESQLLPIKVRVQACDNEKCYPPAIVQDTISIIVPRGNV